MKIKVAFYKAPKDDVFGNFISTYTGIFNRGLPPYCHCEIGMECDGLWRWYSSASRNWDGTTGTRWIDEARLFKNPDRWDIFTIDVPGNVDDVITFCEKEKGKPYDWLGIYGFTTVFGIPNARNKWYCSEVCNNAIFFAWKRRISPKGLFVKIEPYIIHTRYGG